ncbi:MAG TPA: acetylornithine carbamoyltransferase, partial [Chitinophagaceae bacterium]|nr:acetylornithine carbamoyltransferase [Chitinophagaceae bacterium]
MNHFISVHEAGDINALVRTALQFKANPLQAASLGSGKRMGCLFLNPSMRTRLSTQIAAENLGMKVIVF